MRIDPFIKDVSALGIEARCIHIYDTWRGTTYWKLTPGNCYHVTHIRMSSDFTYITLEGVEDTCNSVCFEFMIDGKEHDIYSDERCWPDVLVSRHRTHDEFAPQYKLKSQTDEQRENIITNKLKK